MAGKRLVWFNHDRDPVIRIEARRAKSGSNSTVISVTLLSKLRQAWPLLWVRIPGRQWRSAKTTGSTLV